MQAVIGMVERRQTMPILANVFVVGRGEQLAIAATDLEMRLRVKSRHWPAVNIMLCWVAAPLAAYLARRNLVVGLTFYGLILFNGVLHAVTAIVQGSDAYPGVVTGVLLFIPISLWVICVCLKSGAMSAKALAVSFAGGIAAHIVLFMAYLIFNATQSAPLMLATDIACMALPFLVAGVGSKFLATHATGPRTAA